MKKPIQLETVLKELYSISGLRISVHDTNYNEIAAYPKDLFPFCNMVQQNCAARSICLKDDACAFKTACEKEDAHIYRCHFGLFEAVAPIYHFGVLSGYLMMGQILDTMPESRETAQSRAAPYVSDKDQLKKTVLAIPQSSREKLSSCLSIMTICAEYITLMNYLNLSDKNLAHEVKKHINQNFSSKVTIEFLCKQFFCSKSTLMNSFKKCYHQTVMEYLTQVRLDHAQSMLINTQKTIRVIAQECGFPDQNYFSKVFLKSSGISPSSYRQQARGTE